MIMFLYVFLGFVSMGIPKRYGQSQVTNCVFCGKQATTQSKEGVPVCTVHKNVGLPLLKCLCGEYVDPMLGKWGLYFRCLRCGNVSSKKIFENNALTVMHKRSRDSISESGSVNNKQSLVRSSPEPWPKPKDKKKTLEDYQEEKYVRSDDPAYFD